MRGFVNLKFEVFVTHFILPEILGFCLKAY
jgi:hypothetical protein